MIRNQPITAAIAIIECVLAVVLIGTVEVSAQDGPTLPANGKRASVELKLTPEEEQLVSGSRAAIIETGFSKQFFNAHFKPTRVFNSPADKRVVWKFSINGYETNINDAIGFYTDERGRRIYTHTVQAMLGKTHDIRRTISRAHASRLMKACIGVYEGEGAIVYQRFGHAGQAALIFTAVSVPPPAGAATANTNSGTAHSQNKLEQPASQQVETSSAEVPRPGGKKKPFLSIGSVDLETGRCTRGVAQVGSPQPPPASRKSGQPKSQRPKD